MTKENQDTLIDELVINDEFLSLIPQVDSKIDYWLVRAEGGSYFQDFLTNDYIAIGWNDVSIKEIGDTGLVQELLRSKLASIYPDKSNPGKNKRSMGSAAGQLIRFIGNMKKDDVVLIPSENANTLAVGIIISDAYEEKDEELLDIPHCPYSKRRKIEWRGTFSKNDVDPAMTKLIYSGHTISKINEYKSYINRALFDTYIEDDEMHLTLHVKHEAGVDLDSLTKILKSYNDISKSLYPDEKVNIRINVQSPGPMEIIGAAMVISSVAGLIYYNTNIRSVIKMGGKIGALGTSLELPNRTETEWKIEKEERELRMAEEKHEMDKENHEVQIISEKMELYKAAKEFEEAFGNVGGVFPSEFVKAVEKSDLSRKKRTKNKK